MQGLNRTWFAGAYNRHGFHEDGIASAMAVVDLIGAQQVAAPTDLTQTREAANGAWLRDAS
mgnify:FL=1